MLLNERYYKRLGPIIFLLIILYSPFCYAGVENRPLNTDDAYTLEKGVFSIAKGVVFTKADNSDEEIDVNIDLGYGITEKFEITADFPIIFSNPKDGNSDEGIGDISLRPEFMILEEKENIPSISLANTFKFQTGDEDKGLGSGETDYSISFQASKQFTPIAIHFNLGYTFIGESEGEDLDNIIFYNFAYEYALLEKLTLVGEFIGQTNSDPTATGDPMEILVGAIYNIASSATLDAGLGAGLTAASPDIRVTVGITYEF